MRPQMNQEQLLTHAKLQATEALRLLSQKLDRRRAAQAVTHLQNAFAAANLLEQLLAGQRPPEIR